MSDIGNTLREARVRRGLSIKDVEAATKIRSKYLEALEEDDFEVIPASTYARAFLRTYATLLKLDADALVEEYERSYAPRNREDAMPLHGDAAPRGGSRTVAEQQKRKRRRTQRGYALIVVLAVVAVGLLAWLGAGLGGKGAATLSSGSFGSSTTSTSLGEVSSTSTSAPAQNSTTSSSVVITGQNVVMVLSVSKGECWVVVHEDNESGAELYADTLPAGQEQTFNSSKRYWMRVGSPDVLNVTVNGTAMKLNDVPGVFVVTEAGIQTGE